MKTQALTKTISILSVLALSLATLGINSRTAHAISEKDYAKDYKEKVLPFLSEKGEMFRFLSADKKHALSGIKFIHPQEKALIVVVNGQAEPWLKYLEVFYDLYQKGYSVYSYDHRGQGFSPHLSERNTQIGHVERFQDYTDDLKEFMTKVIQPVHPDKKNLFLIAHSMGGAISAEYLELNESPFQAVVLSAPMFKIITKPYPEKVARAIVKLSRKMGLGDHYAIGKKDYDFNMPFGKNTLTGSTVRWKMSRDTFKNNSSTTIGGPSNAWVHESLLETAVIRKKVNQIHVPILILQAEWDQLVVNAAQTTACESIGQALCEDVVIFKKSQHEILMEQDFIRDAAFKRIDKFFGFSE